VRVYPNREASYLATAGLVAFGIGFIAQEPAILGWAGCLLIGLTLARVATLMAVTRIRAAGFEMLWRSRSKAVRLGRGESVTLFAELRNRDKRAVRFERLRALSSSALAVRVVPEGGQVPGRGRLRIEVHVEALRVGMHGLHGLSLEVQGGPGLFEVPLTFANPTGFEVLPKPYAALARSPRGGRSRASTAANRASRLSGDSTELREIREHQPGDPFKRIAWKASARRGVLLVRDYERDERNVVWLVLDASVELWAGAPGRAALDLAIDEVAGVAQRHLGRGDQVGLMVVAGRVLESLAPARGVRHSLEILLALARGAATRDHDRSALDESDVALRVLEHMRPFDPRAANGIRANDLERLARRAARVVRRAPLDVSPPSAPTSREQALRGYLAAFGIDSPPRLETDRARTDACLLEALTPLCGTPRPEVLVYLWSPPATPGTRSGVEAFLGQLPRAGRAALRWVPMWQEPSIVRGSGDVASVVADAVSIRTRIAEQRGVAALRQLGVRVDRVTTFGVRRHHPLGGAHDPGQLDERTLGERRTKVAV
jgi:uncharacterized protein (DUF58 family)